VEQDTAIIADPAASVRHKVASRLVRIEKMMLEGLRLELLAHADSLKLTLSRDPVLQTPSVKLVSN
jgi:hypothetical protein